MENENMSCKNPKAITIILIVLGLISIVIVSILRDRIVNPQYRQVTIAGQGKVSYEPDLAIVTLGVQIDKDKTADGALQKLNEKMTKIIAAVKAEKVDDADISTANYSLYPQYDYKDNISTVSGYNANEQLVVKVREYDKDVNKLNKIISAASKAGANQVNSLSFDASNMNDLKQQARLLAIADAKSKGEVLAKAAGVELKNISSWYENQVQGPTPYYSYADGKGGMGGGGGYSPQTPSGTKEIIIEMNISYNIK